MTELDITIMDIKSTEEYLNNQVARISLSVDMSQPGSPAITVISQVARE